MFASKYLLKNYNSPLIEQIPQKETSLIVVIPCLNEPAILHSLSSLKSCYSPSSKAEVIVVVNHSETASEEIQRANQLTKIEVDEWIESNQNDAIRFYCVGPVVLKKKWAGAGVARKKGMDEAVRRFNLLNKKSGIIISLDADTLVEANYLK